MCGVLAALPDADHSAVVPLGGFAIATWIVYRSPMSTRGGIWIAYVEAVAAAVTILATGEAESPVLPYLLSPGLAMGLLAGPRAVVQ